MSVQRLEQAIRDLYATADALEGRAAASTSSLDIASPTCARQPSAPLASDRPSGARMVFSTLAHTAASIAVLGLVFAAGDPLMPRPARPSLAASADATTGDVAGLGPIPPLGANQP